MPHLPRHAATPVRRTRAGLVALVAALVTGGVVAVGAVAPQDAEPAGAAASLSSATVDTLSADELAEREEQVSRSTERTALAADSEAQTAKGGRLSSDAGMSRSGSRDLSDADPKTLARALMGEYGLSSGEFGCLEQLWEKESGWSTTADNPTSSAYGIPQALPGSKMSSAGPDWASSAETQIRWGLGYIRDRYGSACAAWGHSESNNWY